MANETVNEGVTIRKSTQDRDGVLSDEDQLEAEKKRVREIQDQTGPFQEKSAKQHNAIGKK